MKRYAIINHQHIAYGDDGRLTDELMNVRSYPCASHLFSVEEQLNQNVTLDSIDTLWFKGKISAARDYLKDALKEGSKTNQHVVSYYRSCYHFETSDGGILPTLQRLLAKCNYILFMLEAEQSIEEAMQPFLLQTDATKYDPMKYYFQPYQNPALHLSTIQAAILPQPVQLARALPQATSAAAPTFFQPKPITGALEMYLHTFDNRSELYNDAFNRLGITEEEAKQSEIPFCPISMVVPNHPVSLDDEIYEYDELVKLPITDGKRQNPLTRAPFDLSEIQAARKIKGKIEALIQNKEQELIAKSTPNCP